jgi:hypothetical protein
MSESERDTPGAPDDDREIREAANPDYVNDDDFADPEEAVFGRDSSGQLKAQKCYVDELDAHTLARPLKKPQREMIEALQDPDSDRDELSDAELAELFDDRLERPDLTTVAECQGDRVTERFVADEMSPEKQEGYLIGILLASDMNDMVRLMRNELTDKEMRMAAIAQQADNGLVTESAQGNRRGRTD